MTIRVEKKTAYIAAAALGCVLVYMFFTWFAWKQVPIGDQVFDLVAIDSFSKKIPTEYLESCSHVHPPSYILAVSSVIKSLNIPTVKAAKVLGVGCFFAVLSLIYLISLRIIPAGCGHAAAIAAVCLYAINPAVISGAQVLKQDTSILPIALLLFVLVFIKLEQEFRLPGVIVLHNV